MGMPISRLYNDIVNCGEGSAAALLIFHARPPCLVAFAAAPTVETVPPQHYHRVTETRRLKSWET